MKLTNKSFICVFLILLLILSLSACGKEPLPDEAETENINIAAYSEGSVEITLQKNLQTITVTRLLSGKNNQIRNITQTTTMDTSSFSDEEMEILKKDMDDITAACESFDGIEYKVSVQGDLYTETFQFDTSEPEKINTILSSGYLDITVSGDSIPLTDSIQNMLADGWIVCD